MPTLREYLSEARTKYNIYYMDFFGTREWIAGGFDNEDKAYKELDKLKKKYPKKASGMTVVSGSFS